jgi:serine/threonine protein kinase
MSMDRLGKYELLKRIGEGSTATVFLAHDPFADRDVAIKLLRPSVFNEDERGHIARKLFMAEAAFAGRLHHPHIAQIYDAVIEDERSYIVMEYVPGGTLLPFTAPDQLLPIGDVLEIVFKCSRALDYAHRLGVIHRDLKPANILRGSIEGGTDVKISDFGSAFTITGDQTVVSGIGSPAYMSPQQIREHPLNHQTDIFSLGVVMYELLTGQRPFIGDSNVSVGQKVLHRDPPPPSSLRRQLPAGVDAIVGRCLRKALDERYSDWNEVSLDLAELVRSDAVDALRASRISDSQKFTLLRALSFFREFSDADLWEILHLAEWKQVKEDTRVLREGDRGESFSVLVSGELSVTKKGRLLNVLTTGECYGEMAYLCADRGKRGADVTALRESTVLEIGTAEVQLASAGCRHNVDRAFLRILVERLDLSNSRLVATPV